MEVVLCLSQKVAKNGQILSMFVPKKWLFSLLLQPHQGWLFKLKNWLMSKICQPFSLVSGFIGLNWFGFLHCLIMDTEKSIEPMFLISTFWVMDCLCCGFSLLPAGTKVIHSPSDLFWLFMFMVWRQTYDNQPSQVAVLKLSWYFCCNFGFLAVSFGFLKMF